MYLSSKFELKWLGKLSDYNKRVYSRSLLETAPDAPKKSGDTVATMVLSGDDESDNDYTPAAEQSDDTDSDDEWFCVNEDEYHADEFDADDEYAPEDIESDDESIDQYCVADVIPRAVYPDIQPMSSNSVENPIDTSNNASRRGTKRPLDSTTDNDGDVDESDASQVRKGTKRPPSRSSNGESAASDSRPVVQVQKAKHVLANMRKGVS